MVSHQPMSHAHPFPIAQLDLVEEVRQLRISPRPHGHVAKTVVRNPDLRVVLMVLHRSARIARHHAAGSMLVQAIDGRVSITLLDSTFELGPGGVFAISPDIDHDIVALDDAALMLTIAHEPAPDDGATRRTGYSR